MSGYWDTLRRSLIDRAGALGNYVDGLQAANNRTDDGFALALEMCRRYTEIFVRQVEFDWNQAANDEDRRHMELHEHLERFLQREKWIDQRFARGSQQDVPRALKTIARTEFEAHGLQGHEPVLTVGPPDSFETHQFDLFQHLFGELYLAGQETGLRTLRDAAKLSIITVPYIEGTRALWHPITIGHQIAHLRLEHAHSLGARAELTRDWTDDPRLDGLLEGEHKRSGRWLPRVVLLRALESWVNEVLCDLNAVRLFGPAGLSSIAEFLAVLSVGHPGDAEAMTETHPPLSLRLRPLFRYLERRGDRHLPAHAAVWHDYLRTVSAELPPLAAFLAEKLVHVDHADRLIDFVESWGPQQGHNGSRDAAAWVERDLLDGIPGDTHYGVSPGGHGQNVAVADVVNAAWAARTALDIAASGGGVPAGALVESQITPHEKRLRIDSLASKAIDSIELSRLWGPDRGVISFDDQMLADAAAAIPTRMRRLPWCIVAQRDRQTGCALTAKIGQASVWSSLRSLRTRSTTLGSIAARSGFHRLSSLGHRRLRSSRHQPGPAHAPTACSQGVG